MAGITSVDLARVAGENLEQASPDLLRAMVKTFAEALMGAEADALCGAPYGQPSEERVNYRNGYRDRRWDTRAGMIELAIPRLRQGSYFPEWLLERRRRSEQAPISVVATSYLLGVSTRRVEKLAETLGIKSLSKSQVSELAKSLDGAVEQFRSRPLDGGPYRFVQADALTLRAREGGRTVLVHGLIATGVNADGKREILGFEVTSAEDGAGWLAFFRGLVARGLSGVVLVASDAYAGLVAAIAATLPGASWQRCRTHYANVLAALPKSAHPGARKALAEIWGAEDKNRALAAVKAFEGGYGAKFPKAVAKITGDLDQLLAVYDHPAEHWVHLRTTNAIESTFATVRHRTKITKGPGSRAAGLAMAFKLIESAQNRWRAVNAPHLVALVRAGARFEHGRLVERDEQAQAPAEQAA